jgi:hypothetical protein
MKTRASFPWLWSVVAASAFLATAGASVIGPWPTDGSQMWENQPIPGYTGGSVSIVTPPAQGTLNMPAFTGGTKTSWLPYGGTYAEKMTIAGAIFSPGTVLDTVHAKVYDPFNATGKSGWAVILKDSTGKILDFGIRGFFASKQIIPHQYDGSAWTTTPVMTRTLTGNNYYTMDFDKQEDGTIKWAINAYENGVTWAQTNFTSVLYGDLTEVYLNVMTPDTSGAATYKWTEFSYTVVPEPGSAVLIGGGFIALVAWLRRGGGSRAGCFTR